jgi:hypothetical protein
VIALVFVGKRVKHVSINFKTSRVLIASAHCNFTFSVLSSAYVPTKKNKRGSFLPQKQFEGCAKWKNWSALYVLFTVKSEKTNFSYIVKETGIVSREFRPLAGQRCKWHGLAVSLTVLGSSMSLAPLSMVQLYTAVPQSSVWLILNP